MPADEIGKTHVAEGVVVRIDNRATFTAYKDKVFEFKVIEGIAKDTSDVLIWKKLKSYSRRL